jgi:glycosyltransferase involved in cell wall biosynthesis
MRGRLDLGCAARLARIVREEGYHLIHTHTPRAALVGRIASLLTGVPMVHHVHSPTARDTEGGMRNRINTIAERLSLLGVKRLIPVSRSLEGYLVGEGYSRAIIRAVPNGVPTPGPLPDRAAPGDEWVIGVVALFRPRKGIEVLVEAASLLKKAGQRFRIRAVGGFETPEYEASIKALARQIEVADCIDWTGFTRDVNAEFARMDVMVLPSLYGEGMPMVILEAMATGVPVVSSEVEGVPEVLEQGATGLMVAPGEAAPLADALRALMMRQYDWVAMRARAYDAQVERFSDASMARKVGDVYREVVSIGQPGERL